jgi:ABC-type Na+ transport system ATPase subunit NatA
MAAIDDLRRASNEPADDSDYSDAMLEAILQNAKSVPAAAAVVWREKAAKYAQLVDLQEGETRRNLSDLSGNALDMAKMFQSQADTKSPGGHRPTSVGRITRA